MVETAKNYKQSVAAFYKFDQILSGSCAKGVTEKELRIVESSIKAVLGQPSEQKMDPFVVNNFIAFTRKKTRIVLDLSLMYLRKNELNDLIVHSLERRGAYDDIPSDDTNCIKPLLFELFPNLTQIRIYAVDCSFNFLSLLRILKSVEFPASFKELIIKDDGDWIKDVFGDELVKKYAEQGLRFVFDDSRTAVISV